MRDPQSAGPLAPLVALAASLGFVTFAIPADAAAFNCTQAKTQAQKMVCADPKLSRLDEEMATEYRLAIRAAPSEPRREQLRHEQGTWLKRRDACAKPACIESAYLTSLDVLAGLTVDPSGDAFRVSGKTFAHAAQARLPRPKDEADTRAFASFRLTRGRAEKVCEAYLQRLNRAWYPQYPKCDRPEDGRVEGFRELGRVALSAEEVQPFWASVQSFIMDGDPDLWKRHEEWLAQRGLPPRFGDREQQLGIVRGESTLRVFRFEPPIDIDNDGKPDPVIVWRQGQCALLGEETLPRSSRSIPIVLNTAGDGPNVDLTRALFGHPSGGYRLSSGEMTKTFRPVGTNVGIFEFEGRYYLDSFFDEWGDFDGNRRNDPEISNRLGVFLIQGRKATQLCEYWMEDYIDSAGLRMREQFDAWKKRKRSR